MAVAVVSCVCVCVCVALCCVCRLRWPALSFSLKTKFPRDYSEITSVGLLDGSLLFATSPPPHHRRHHNQNTLVSTSAFLVQGTRKPTWSPLHGTFAWDNSPLDTRYGSAFLWVASQPVLCSLFEALLSALGVVVSDSPGAEAILGDKNVFSLLYEDAILGDSECSPVQAVSPGELSTKFSAILG
jgi:hypothetical protein